MALSISASEAGDVVFRTHSVTVKVPSFCCSNSLTSARRNLPLRDLDKYPLFRKVRRDGIGKLVDRLSPFCHRSRTSSGLRYWIAGIAGPGLAAGEGAGVGLGEGFSAAATASEALAISVTIKVCLFILCVLSIFGDFRPTP